MYANTCTAIIKWSSIPTETTPTKLAKPPALKFITLTSPVESQNSQNRFQIRSHVVRNRRITHTDNVHAFIQGKSANENSLSHISAMLYQSCSTPIQERLIAQSLSFYRARAKAPQSKLSSFDKHYSAPNVTRMMNNPCTLLSANNVDHFSQFPMENRPVITEKLGHCKKGFIVSDI